MAYRYHGRASVDPTAPSPFAVCDRCGRWYNLPDLKWQMQYAGAQLINLRWLVCDECLDTPQPQLRSIVLPADPKPVINARPEYFYLDETDWLSSQDGITLTTEDGNPLITQNPNPNGAAAQANLTAAFSLSVSVDLSDVYVDLLFQGTSILPTITGSASHVAISSALWIAADIAKNTDFIVVTTSALAQCNVDAVALYSASGTLLGTSTTGATEPLIVVGGTVQFRPASLSITRT